MKIIINKSKYILLFILFSCLFSCNESEFLEEEALNFYSLENSYLTPEQFESALTDLYAKVRIYNFGGGDNEYGFVHFLATDIAFHARETSGRFGDYDVYMVPTNNIVGDVWDFWYKVIANANTIISRLESSELTDEEQVLVGVEAKFFRAYAYRYLVYLYGGVPLILEEVTAPKDDYVRASKEEVLEQMVSDFKNAAENLPSISEVTDGRVSNLVAYHYLAETYISLGKYDEAITAASEVINDVNTSLMTDRFGSRANEDPYDEFLKFTKPGDVFWDLFQPNNQNRRSGNTEALWVAQMEVDTDGGLLSSTSNTGNCLERWAAPAGGGISVFLDPDGYAGTLSKAQSNYNSAGRGVSFIQNTDFFLNTLWESDFDNDIRNSEHNIVRDIVYNNPESAYYGQSAVLEDGTLNSPTWQNQHWRWYPYPSKITTPGKHPDALFEDKDNLTLTSAAGSTYRDMYILRLPETYLLRAEAYFDNGDATNAAADINVVRGRAEATPVNASDVTLDYILDERARELVYEEPRRITLMRTSKLVERVRLYNQLNSDEIKDYHNLWPIPYADIEANTGAVLEQNPGYE
ncbi:RagB/SusD family nutrient uptake outer membrane protein [Sunxiuqinia indica]|uniref:RagB/SusD family nutrient uptake outer membrane protein n=1 Tax=Sunxiuqinia indica TaxID=2692584 RepID=UPI0013586140|nr:RagB/SusD family nutrient uptake outer membrane protein [Sunxiuqinia indica]